MNPFCSGNVWFLASLSSLPLTISLLTSLHFLKAEIRNLRCQLFVTRIQALSLPNI